MPHSAEIQPSEAVSPDVDAQQSQLPEVQTGMPQLLAASRERGVADEPSDWYLQQKRELDAFEASGYTDLSVLHVDEPTTAAIQRTLEQTQIPERVDREADRPRLHRRVAQSIGRAVLRRRHGRQTAEAVSEEQPVITESIIEDGLTLRSYRYQDREVLELSPDSIREDPSTGEPVAPLVFIQGIGGSGELLPKDLALFAQAGKRVALGVRMLGKDQGTSAKFVDAGLPVRVPRNYYQQSRAILKSLTGLGIRKVDLVAVSEGAIPAVAVRDEMVKDAELPEVGDTILVHPQGLDGRSYIGRHRGGARLIRQTKALNMQNPEARVKAKGNWNDGQTFRQLNAKRKGSAKADMRQTLAATPVSLDTQSITIVGGKHDPAISAARLQRYIIEPDRVAFVESDWGGVGHGFGVDREVAIKELSDLLLIQEQRRQAA